MHNTVRLATRSNPVRRHGDAWRRHVRHHAPAPAAIPPFARQRVQNVFHHLEDLSLPYDLWNDDAELAAIVHLLGRHSEDVAARLYVDAVQAYNAFHRRFEPAIRPFSSRDAAAKVRRVAAIRNQLPAEASDGAVYAAVLGAWDKEYQYDHSPIAV